MSIELPEVDILARQLDECLGKREIASIEVDNYEKLQKSSFFNKDVNYYQELVGGKVTRVVGRGTVIRLSLQNKMNLLLAPEMGGELRFLEGGEKMPRKYHLLSEFKDGSVLSVQLKGYGPIFASHDDDLGKIYSYDRDFLHGISPLEPEFTADYVYKALGENDKNLKTLMVGKEAIVVGYGNAGFQEIAYEAGIHPKRKSSTFSSAEMKALHKAIKKITELRIKKGGKDSFTDIYGKPGTHIPLIGGHMRDRECPKCGTKIERLMFGGGPTYLCPSCQI